MDRFTELGDGQSSKSLNHLITDDPWPDLPIAQSLWMTAQRAGGADGEAEPLPSD
jgi:hypothetical protein